MYGGRGWFLKFYVKIIFGSEVKWEELEVLYVVINKKFILVVYLVGEEYIVFYLYLSVEFGDLIFIEGEEILVI